MVGKSIEVRDCHGWIDFNMALIPLDGDPFGDIVRGQQGRPINIFPAGNGLR